MKITQTSQAFAIETAKYSLDLASGMDISHLLDKSTGRLFAYVSGGSCNTVEAKDDAQKVSGWRLVEQSADCAVFEREEKSSCWDNKTSRIRLFEEVLEFQYVLQGQGALEDIRFFRPLIKGVEFGFCGDIDEIYTTAPNFQDREYYHPVDTVVITYGNDLDVRTGGHALASTPHVMALHDRRDAGYVSASIFAQPGEYQWDDMFWNPKAIVPPTAYIGDCVIGGGFAINYYGKKQVNGTWETPRLCLKFVNGQENVLPDALEYAYGKGYLPRPGKHPHPAWMERPIYCTWHDQTACAEADMLVYDQAPEHGPAEFCTQENVDRWLALLEEHDCKPGIVVLDYKWQRSFASADVNTNRWPDLRGWIDKCHERDIRVCLWWPAWFADDITPDMAITRDGKVLCGDPTNPKYEALLREMFRKFFSEAPDCLNADAVKIDGLLGLPVGPGLQNLENLWGLELQRRLLTICHDAAHRAKADVCVGLFTGHPYLDDVTDMVRLADLYTWRVSTKHTSEVRAHLYRSTNPHVPMDTDGQLQFTIAPDYMDALKHAKDLGCIPTTYNAELLRRRRFFFPPLRKSLDEQDYRKLSEIFHRK